MEKNIGKTDKYIRLVIGLVLIIVGFYTKLWWVYVIALIPIVTALISFCPLYKLIKFNSNK